MKPYALLDFPIKQIRDDFVLPRGPSKDNVIFFRGEDVGTIFTQEFLQFLTDQGTIPHSVLIFHHLPHVDYQRIHIDNPQSQTSDLTFAFNWIFCEGECATRWFKPKIVDGKPYEGFKIVNNPHEVVVNGKRHVTKGYTVTQFDPEMVEVETELKDKGPFLIQANIPHRGVNLSDHDRWSISLRTTHDVPNAESLFQLFKPWTINERPTT